MTARTWFNGRPAESVPVDNRGLAYGDGLFETIAVRDGHPRLLAYHRERLALGCRRLAIAEPVDLWEPILADLKGDGVLKVVVTRGASGRGYASTAQAGADCLVQWLPATASTAFEVAAPITVIVCRQRLARQPILAGLKHLNRLEQVLARAEWCDPAIAEGLMLDTAGLLVEGVMSNLFAIGDGRLLTPRLDQCGVAGVLRRLVIEQLAPAAGMEVAEVALPADSLASLEALFLTNSLRGIVPVGVIDGRQLPSHPVTRRLQQLLCEAEAAGHV